MSNYYHQKRSTVVGQAVGFPQRAYLADVEWFYNMAPLLGSDGGDALTFGGMHSLKPGHGWIQLYALPHTVQAAFKGSGDEGAAHGMWEPEAFWPGDSAALQQMVEQLKFGDYILLLEDRAAGSNQFIQFGTIDQPLNFRPPEYESGNTKEGKKGWKICGSSALRYFYSPGTSLGLHPDTIIFLNQLAFAEDIELTMEQELILDRLVRDLHGEPNGNYTTYDIWSLGVAMYPFIGNSRDSHKYNLFNPSDTDVAFRLTFDGAGNEDHDYGSHGTVQWDGASWADTHLVPDDVFTLDDGCHGVALLKFVAGESEYGALTSGQDNFFLKFPDGSNDMYLGIHSKDPVAFNYPTFPGLYQTITLNRFTGVDAVRLFDDVSVLFSASDAGWALATDSVMLGKIQGEGFSNNRVNGYWFFHSLATQAQVLALNKAVKAFNVALGRM